MFELTRLGKMVKLPWKPCILVTTSKVSMAMKLLYPWGIKYKHHLEHPFFNSVATINLVLLCIAKSATVDLNR